MSGHDMCRSYLIAQRIVARRNGGKSDTDHGWTVTHTTDRKWWLVRDAKDKTVWEGEACCAYDARAEALVKVPS